MTRKECDYEQKFKEQLEMEEFRTQTFNDLAGEKLSKLGDLIDVWKKAKVKAQKFDKALETLKQTHKTIGEWLCNECDGEEGWNTLIDRLSQQISELEPGDERNSL